MKHVIIGTAGHIDHGKTSLIRALTGRDTDRLEEEKRRGITIDLGFTWFDLKDGTRCGIIDVPGHEKFINNMVSGVVGMDLVLMVIAADEGIMPQTREHLDILQLLGIEKTILVITKCDLVEPEWLDMMEEEIKEGLKDTILDGAPSVRVSSTTGMGIDELKDIIWKTVRDEVPERDVNSIPRLPIDRVFTISGFGTIVTGTLLSGTITKNDDLELYPTGKMCKIRNIQVHERNQDQCQAGQRVAINLSNVKKSDIKRGYCLAPPDSMENSRLLDVRLRVLESSERVIRNRERLHLFVGTSEVLCRAVLLDKDDLGPGEEGLAQLILEDVLTVKRGDRFVVRFYSPLETIGGGTVLGANSRKKKRFQEGVLDELSRKESGSLADLAELHIREAWDNMITLSELAKTVAHSREELLPYLKQLADDELIEAYEMTSDVYYWHSDAAFKARQDITNALKEYHFQYPYRYGISKATIHHTYLKRVKTNIFDRILRRMIDKGYFKLHNEYVMLAEFDIPDDKTHRAVEKLLIDTFETAGYEMLRFSEIDKKGYSDEVVMDILSLLMEDGRCVRVGDTLQLYTMKHFMDDARDKVLQFFETSDLITIKDVKEMCGCSRKCAKPIVEYLDSIKVTKKVGAETERVPFRSTAGGDGA